MWVFSSAWGPIVQVLLLRAWRDRGKKSPYPNTHQHSEEKKEGSGEMHSKSRSCFPHCSSLWAVSMVIAVSSYVLFNLHALERSHVMLIRRVFFHDCHTFCLCETLQDITSHFFSQVCVLDTICLSYPINKYCLSYPYFSCYLHKIKCVQRQL